MDAEFQTFRGVDPNVCLKAAIYALTLEYPDSSAA
jgi:hypothetical protein